MSDTPITRFERFAAGEAGSDTPITREEMILSGADVTPVTRRERFLKAAVEGGGSQPTGEIDITQNGTHNVRQYATANVHVPQPSGKFTITENGTDIEIADYATVDVAVPLPEEYAIGGSLADKTLTGYHFKSGITSIPTLMFTSCPNLGTIQIPDTVTIIGNQAFGECERVTITTLPTSLVTIENNAFRTCRSLAGRLVFPVGVTVLPQTGFSNTALTAVECLGDITTVKTQCFYNVPLEYIDFRYNTQVPSLTNANAFSGTPTSMKIIVPDALVTAWKTETNWINYEDRIVGVSDV